MYLCERFFWVGLRLSSQLLSPDIHPWRRAGLAPWPCRATSHVNGVPRLTHFGVGGQMRVEARTHGLFIHELVKAARAAAVDFCLVIFLQLRVRVPEDTAILFNLGALRLGQPLIKHVLVVFHQ